jgi:potassium efflux system protein
MKYSFIIYGIILALLPTLFCSAQVKDTTSKTADSSAVIPDTLLFKIQTAQAAITEINSSNEKGYNIEGLRRQLADIKTNIAPLQKEFKTAGKKIEGKSLMSYNLILKDAQAQLATLIDVLMKNNSDLQRKSQQVVELSSDSLLTNYSADDTQKKLYKAQLSDLKLRLHKAGKLTGENLAEVSKLLADVSALSIVVNDLQNNALEQIKKSGRLAFTQQEPYLWNAPLTGTGKERLGPLLSASFQGEQQILGYFINATWDKRILAILLSIAFFIWVNSNFKKSRRPAIKQKVGLLEFDYLRPIPIMATFIILLNITPLFEPDAPALYIELLQLLLLLLMTSHLRKRLSSPELKYWILITSMYALLILGSAAVSDAFPLRIFLIAINAFFIYIGFRLFKKAKIKQLSSAYVKIVAIVVILFNVLAIVFNVAGRVGLAKIFSTTGVICLTQMICLAVFIQLMLDALELQMKISACSKGLFSRINHHKTKVKIKRLLSILAILLWLITFSINLGLRAGVLHISGQILSKQRTFGSIHFTLENILFFTAIVYLANKLQKIVPILFGEEQTKFESRTANKNSKVALIRLVIIILGILLAVTASGLPLDKLTVLIGALGVGIGLGMQNIVNNFVSGIILIFEKPFRIGDYVELADKKGKVQDIGIRSSKLLTPQGSEVIIPNGDLLSGRLVNWTLSNDLVKTELLIKVGLEADIDLVFRKINKEVQASSHAMKNLPPEVLINNITADAVEIKILTWVTNIYIEAAFKSELLRRLHNSFKVNQIKMM